MANYQQKSSIDQKMLERKKLEKITTGEIKVKKASGGSRIAKKIFAEDMNAVKRYIIDDLLIPNIKNFAIDAFSTLLNVKLPQEILLEPLIMFRITGHPRH